VLRERIWGLKRNSPHALCYSEVNYHGNFERLLELVKRVRNSLKKSSHDFNGFSAQVVVLVDLFGLICAPLILSLNSISLRMIYILDLAVED